MPNAFFLFRKWPHFLGTMNCQEEFIMNNEKTGLLDPLMDIKAVTTALCRSRASIYRDIKAERFPKPLKNRGSVRWRTSVIRDFIDNLHSE